MGARLRDVADHAGVSVKTVSNVVRGHPSVSRSMRAKRLGDRPVPSRNRVCRRRSLRFSRAAVAATVPPASSRAASSSRAGGSGRRLPTLTIDTRIGFRSAADRAAFADELTAAVLDLAARYHHDDGRPHRLVVAAHPLPEESA